MDLISNSSTFDLSLGSLPHWFFVLPHPYLVMCMRLPPYFPLHLSSLPCSTAATAVLDEVIGIHKELSHYIYVLIYIKICSTFCH